MENVTCYFEDESHETVVCNGTSFSTAELIQPDHWQFWLYLILYCVLVCFAGVCLTALNEFVQMSPSGLNIRTIYSLCIVVDFNCLLIG